MFISQPPSPSMLPHTGSARRLEARPAEFSGQPLFGAKKSESTGGNLPAKPANMKKPPKDWEEHPNRLVQGSTERLARSVAKKMGLTVNIDPAEKAKVDKIYASGKSLIVAPTHGTTIDWLAQLLVETETGHRNLRMGAREVLFEPTIRLRIPGTRITLLKFKNKLQGWLMSRNGAFSVNREGDGTELTRRVAGKLGEGKHVTMLPQGHITNKSQLTLPEEYKDGAAWIAIQAAQEEHADGTHTQTAVVPYTLLFEPKGDPQEIRESLEAGVKELEEAQHSSSATKGQDKLKPAVSNNETPLEKRLEVLFAQMVSEREERYLKQYPELSLDRSGSDFYARLDQLNETLLNQMEQHYFGAAKSGSVERRARKLKGHIARFDKVDKQNLRDLRALKDIMGLSLYERGYLDHSLTRQTEMLYTLGRDMQGAYKLPVILRFLRKAKVEIGLKVGDPIDVNKALEQGAQQELSTKDVAKRITGRIQQEHQLALDAAFPPAALPPGQS